MRNSKNLSTRLRNSAYLSAKKIFKKVVILQAMHCLSDGCKLVFGIFLKTFLLFPVDA